jgi:hypothetical protein
MRSTWEVQASTDGFCEHDNEHSIFAISIDSFTLPMLLTTYLTQKLWSCLDLVFDISEINMSRHLLELLSNHSRLSNNRSYNYVTMEI